MHSQTLHILNSAAQVVVHSSRHSGRFPMSEEVTLDKLQDGIDAFMLSLFESVRQKTEGVDPEVNAKNVLEKYNSVLSSIDNLVGINQTKEEQVSELRRVSELCEQKRASILRKEKELKDLAASTDKEIHQVSVGCLHLRKMAITQMAYYCFIDPQRGIGQKDGIDLKTLLKTAVYFYESVCDARIPSNKQLAVQWIWYPIEVMQNN